MSIVRLVITTSIAMIAFAGNSLLCRVALTTTSIDAASFTTIRIVSGAVTLFILILLTRRSRFVGGMPPDFLLLILIYLPQQEHCCYLVPSSAR